MAKLHRASEVSDPHALYRFFGAGGTLLYIGITNSIPVRLKNHSRDKPWWLGVTSITVEHYPNRAAVLEAERRAIRAEKPLYNDQHNKAGRWSSDPEVPAVNSDSDTLIPICMGCGNSIEDWENGLLHVCHFEVHKAERAWSEWNANSRQTITISDLDGMPDLARWQVHCLACNPHYDPREDPEPCCSCYAISTEECRSFRALLRWTSHLGEKDWLAATNWGDLIGAVARGDDNAGFVTEAAYAAEVVD